METFSIPTTSVVPVANERWTVQFERQARLNPANPAVVSGNLTMSYAELDRRSNQIADLLRESGIGRGSFVGLGLHRCLELPVALLGVLKSGAAYVPLDPGYPAARIHQMIEYSQLTHVITQQELAAHFPEMKLIPIDGPIPANPAATTGPTAPTKAETGDQGGFENLQHWYSIELHPGPCDRTLAISPPSFDLTRKNFFAPLLAGGTLVLDDCQNHDVSRISNLIRQQGITMIHCTPGAFYPLVDAAAADDYQALATIRFAVLGGEAITIPRLRGWLESPNCQAEVVNCYGPTESTDACAFYRLHQGNLDDFPFVPLGREIPTGRDSIRNEPSLTADGCATSIYRTADPTKGHPSNILEFRGRADHPVKVNGIRIELGKIEVALNQHGAVRGAVVVASHDRLIAHVRGTATIGELRAYLASRLPAHMVPGEFHWVESFPLTPAGKIDRLALATAMPRPATQAVSGTAMEAKILSLWSEVLGRPVNDATANFFDLGGNSIHIAITHVRLMEMTGRLFPISELFDGPSARSIAGFLSPTSDVCATETAPDRARLTQAGHSGFRRSSRR